MVKKLTTIVQHAAGKVKKNGDFPRFSGSIRILKIAMVRRNQYILKNVIEVEEFHDGRYGAPGRKREKKKKATKEDVERVNQWNKEKGARRRLRMYFDTGKDWFTTLTYRKEERPPDYDAVKKDLKKFLAKMRKEFARRNISFQWIRNAENTPTGNWHIHLVIKDIPGINIISLMQQAWPHGRVKDPQQLYARGEMRELASYITKSEKTRREYVPNGILDHTVTEAHYSTSRNMPLPPPKPDILKRWKKEVEPKKGYYLNKDTYFEGINPVTGYRYRHYEMVRIVRRE